MGDYTGAITHWQQSLNQARLMKDAHSIGKHLLQLERAQLLLGEFSAAKDQFRQAFEMFQSLRYPLGISQVCVAFSELALAQGQIRIAGYCAGVAENIWRQGGRIDVLCFQEIFTAMRVDPVFQSALSAGQNYPVTAETLDFYTLTSFQAN